MKRFLKLGFVGIALVLLPAAFFALDFQSQIPALWPHEKFTPEAWKTTHPYERFVFYKDLHRRRILYGISRMEAARLLGAADSEGPGGEYFGYVIQDKSTHRFSFDAIAFLRLEFNEDGSVGRYYLGSD